MSYSVWCLCVSLHTFCALSGLCSYSDVLILSFCLNTSRTVTGVMKIEEHTAVSVTPYLCLIVHLCVWVCVCESSCACLSHCICAMGETKQLERHRWSKKQSKEAKWERKRVFVNQFQFNCDFCDEINLGSHFQAHTHTHMKEQSLEIDADIKIPTGDLGYFYQLRWWLMNT